MEPSITDEVSIIVRDSTGKPEALVLKAKDGGVDLFKISTMGIENFKKLLELLTSRDQAVKTV